MLLAQFRQAEKIALGRKAKEQADREEAEKRRKERQAKKEAEEKKRQEELENEPKIKELTDEEAEALQKKLDKVGQRNMEERGLESRNKEFQIKFHCYI